MLVVPPYKILDVMIPLLSELKDDEVEKRKVFLAGRMMALCMSAATCLYVCRNGCY